MMKIYKNWGPPLVTQLMVTSTRLLALYGGKIKIRNFAIPLLCSLILMNSCKSDEAAAPTTASFTVDKTTGVLSSTTFTFTVNQVTANSVTLFPYGQGQANWGTIPITFSGGAATVTFKYDKVGTFNAVVVTNNNTTDPDGKISIKNTVSAAQSITITNNGSTFSKFLVEKSISRTSPLDNVNHVIKDTVPFGSPATLKATFATDGYATVSVGSTAQKTDTTANSFASPVTYTVKSQDGSSTTTYAASVYVIPVETNNSIKSVTGVATSTASKKASVPSSVDNTGKAVVFYQPYGTATGWQDSVEVSYALSGKFSILKYGTEVVKMKQGRRLDLTAASPKVVVFAQDSSQAPYNLYTATQVPKLSLAFNGLVPQISATTKDFGITANVIKGTVITALATTTTITPVAGLTVSSVTAGSVDITAGTAVVDYTKPVTFTMTVIDANIGKTYQVVYTATVTVIP